MIVFLGVNDTIATKTMFKEGSSACISFKDTQKSKSLWKDAINAKKGYFSANRKYRSRKDT